MTSQGTCDLEGVADLPTIPSLVVLLLKPHIVVFGKFEDSLLFNSHFWLTGDPGPFCFDVPQPVDIHLEEGFGFSQAEVRVVKTEVNPRLHRFIQYPSSVGGKKQDSRIVLQGSQEDYNQID